MVVENEIKGLLYPKEAKLLTDIQKSLEVGIIKAGFNERIIFPNYHPLTLHEIYHDDISLEYLVEHVTALDEVFVYNPEMRSVIEFYSNNTFDSISDYSFYFIQNLSYYDSVLRFGIKEDLVIGAAIVNSTNIKTDWIRLNNCAFESLKNLVGNKVSPHHKLNGAVDYKVNDVLIGYAKKEDFSMSFHFSIMDILKLKNKNGFNFNI